jgi:uncharacterized membrane protein
MSQPENLGAFFRENKQLLKEYVETRIEIVRLQGIRMFSKSMGFMVWIIIASLLGFLVLIFSGLVLGFWLSALTHSYVSGFGITTLILLGLLIVLILLRNVLFVNPIIRKVIQGSQETNSTEEDQP